MDVQKLAQTIQANIRDGSVTLDSGLDGVFFPFSDLFGTLVVGGCVVTLQADAVVVEGDADIHGRLAVAVTGEGAVRIVFTNGVPFTQFACITNFFDNIGVAVKDFTGGSEGFSIASVEIGGVTAAEFNAYSLKIATDIHISFGEKLKLENLCFGIERFAGQYELSFAGKVILFGISLDFFTVYRNATLLCAVSECGGAVVPGLSSIGDLVGADCAEFSPFHSGGAAITLDSLSLSLSLKEKRIERLSIGVKVEGLYTLCASPELKIGGLVCKFLYSPGGMGFYVDGTIVFLGIKSALGAGYDAQAGWSFGWRLADDETIPLSKFVRDFADWIGMGEIALRLPEVEAANMAVSYTAGLFDFIVYIRSGDSVFFSSLTTLHITARAASASAAKQFTIDFTFESGFDAGLTLAKALAEIGVPIEGLPDFVADIGLRSLTINYNLAEHTIHFNADINNIGTFSFDYTGGIAANYSFAYAPQIAPLSLAKLPLAGELAGSLVSADTFSIDGFMFRAGNTIGVTLSIMVCGTTETLVIYKPDTNASVAAPPAKKPTTFWVDVNKTFAVITLAKIGVSFERERIAFVVDAIMNVKPFSFSLLGAGIGINPKDLSDVSFALSGFGIAFDNGVLSIAGTFRTSSGEAAVYTGSLLIKFKTVSAYAVAEYSASHFLAYVSVSARIGGIPAFFITGLAFGFGYNKRLLLPKVEEVPQFPLIRAADGGFSPTLLDDLKKKIPDENGQHFLAAGVRFTSFQMVNGFVLLTVSFGREFEIGLLGIAGVVLPPNTKAEPIARAQLALKASINPIGGVVSVEARLTSESYILSKSCRLTGGFAAYFWFGDNEHSGDFVITLGGYHSAYRKPAHYPSVPRLGLNWNVSPRIVISGEIYFALTPSVLMAGGKLSAVYTWGNLRAWFIAYADFLIGWKPFSYAIAIGVSIGASYRVDWWFIHKTFSIELGADMHIWGPEVQGRVHISWFIISFTVSFSTGPDRSQSSLNWDEFKASFLSAPAPGNAAGDGVSNDTVLSADIAGVTGEAADKAVLVNPDKLRVTVSSRIPASGNVRPVGSAALNAPVSLDIVRENGTKVNERFQRADVRGNFPAALWKSAPLNSEKLKESGTVNGVLCGVSFTVKDDCASPLFPAACFINLDDLYRKNTLSFTNCFAFTAETRNRLSGDDSLRAFTENERTRAVSTARQRFLLEHGISEPVNLAILAENAGRHFSENIIIAKD